MDPLTILVSTIALLESSLKVVSFLKGPDQNRLATEVVSLSRLLLDLREWILADGAEIILEDGALQNDLERLKGTVERLATCVTSGNAAGNTLKLVSHQVSLRFHAAEIQKAFAAIERLKSSLTARMQCRSLYVESAIAADMAEQHTGHYQEISDNVSKSLVVM